MIIQAIYFYSCVANKYECLPCIGATKGNDDVMMSKTTDAGLTFTKDQSIYSRKGISAGIIKMWGSFYYMPLEIALLRDTNSSDDLKVSSQSSSHTEVTTTMDTFT